MIKKGLEDGILEPEDILKMVKEIEESPIPQPIPRYKTSFAD